MTKILVNFAGMQELKHQMQDITEQLQALEDDISHSSNRLDWEVSQKHDIDEQIHKARRKAAFLVNYTEQMAIFTERAINDFRHTDTIFANQLNEQTGQLESLWRGFLEFTGHTFNELSCDGMAVLSALRSAGILFTDKAVEVFSTHPELLSILGIASGGVAPLAGFLLSEVLSSRINSIQANGLNEMFSELTSSTRFYKVYSSQWSSNKGTASLTSGISSLFTSGNVNKVGIFNNSLKGTIEGAISDGFHALKGVGKIAGKANPVIDAMQITLDAYEQSKKNQSFCKGAIKVAGHALINIGTGAATVFIAIPHGVAIAATTGPEAVVTWPILITSGGGMIWAVNEAGNQLQDKYDKWLDQEIN